MFWELESHILWLAARVHSTNNKMCNPNGRTNALFQPCRLNVALVTTLQKHHISKKYVVYKRMYKAPTSLAV